MRASVIVDSVRRRGLPQHVNAYPFTPTHNSAPNHPHTFVQNVFADNASGSWNVNTDQAGPTYDTFARDAAGSGYANVDQARSIYVGFNAELRSGQRFTEYYVQPPPMHMLSLPERSPELRHPMPPHTLSGITITAPFNGPSEIPGLVNDLPPDGIGDHSTPNVVVVQASQALGQQQIEHLPGLLANPESQATRPQTSPSCSCTPTAPGEKASRSRLQACLIPGCDQRFRRSDSHTNHLRRKHNMPIPKGCWGDLWASMPENRHHYDAAVEEQRRKNSILAPTTRRRTRRGA